MSAATPGAVVRAFWERTVARVRVAQGDDLFHCLSFADIAAGRIARSVDVWGDDRGDPAPDRRAPYRSEEPT